MEEGGFGAHLRAMSSLWVGGAPTCLGHSLGSRVAEPDTPSPAANAIPLGLIGRVLLEGCSLLQP